MLRLVLCALVAGCASEPFEQLKDWLAASPIPLSMSSGAVRGVSLTQPVADGAPAATVDTGLRGACVGEVMMQIPTERCIFADRAFDTLPELREALLSFDADEQQRQVLALTGLLLWTANGPARKRWAPYLELLPAQLGLPVSYSVSELQELRGSDTLLRIAPQCTVLDQHVMQVKQQWVAVKKLHQSLKTMAQHTSSDEQNEAAIFSSLQLDQVVWAYSVVQSRAFTLHDYGSDTERLLLVPAADMMNHREDAAGPTVQMSIQEGQVVVTAHGGTFAAGDAFEGRYVSGSERSMTSWVASYGFVDRQSLHQGLSIDAPALWKVAKFSSEHSDRLAALLASAGCHQTDRRGKAFGLGKDGFSDGYLGCLRVALLDEGDSADLLDDECPSEQTVGAATELRVHNLVLDFLRAKLKRYSTTIAQDVEVLRDTEISSNLRTIVELRQREKALYLHGVRAMKKSWLWLVGER